LPQILRPGRRRFLRRRHQAINAPVDCIVKPVFHPIVLILAQFFHGSTTNTFFLDNKKPCLSVFFFAFALASLSFAALIDTMIDVACSNLSALWAVFVRFLSGGSSKADHGVSYHAMDAKLTAMFNSFFSLKSVVQFC